MNAVIETLDYAIEAGRAHPLGATPMDGGINFSLYSNSATSVELLLFDEHDDATPFQAIRLDPIIHKTFNFWHVFVRGLQPGVHYAYRVDGPYEPHQSGHRHNRAKVVIDPYAKGVTSTLWDREAACLPNDNVASSLRGVVIDISDYDWEGDQPLNRPLSETVIYEMHPRGFTKHASSGASYPGTFSAVVEKIPYLQELGVTAVELMPIFQFDADQIVRMSPLDGKPLKNYWGYSTISFFAPHSKYCVSPEAGSHIREFRDMVKALHKAGIEVILDVVFNHTDEGNHMGPTISFKGIDNATYYYLEPYDRQYYTDYTGCGNTFNCNHPMAEKFIVDCLEFWVTEMHVDGFRFDEASVLSRGEDGAPMRHPPVLWQIELNERLADTKVIAEAWDAAGLYQVGYFPGYRWAEWNGVYRDDVRRFVKGDAGLAGTVASRLTGSADLYSREGRLPTNSVNFITAHDGFTLNDLVSYNGKHNDANGEYNRDGVDNNLSWNCGVEGATADPAIEATRVKQIKNFAAILMLSQGTPMFVAGDEFRHSQRGNNNAYCQDNEISWLDWDDLERNRSVFEFFKRMIAFRKNRPELHRKRFFTGEVNERGLADVAWHGTRLFQPGWDDPYARALSFTMGAFWSDNDIHVILNMFWEPADFELPEVRGRRWYRLADTGLDSPNDFLDEDHAVPIDAASYRAAARSSVILISK